ncbi:MAG: flagellar biosynthetic protein FliO [Alphaproteobacteria bacterium]|nr:flagellar biosynthetic protein FliO [Alphaproteobacteria bacterium]
MDMDFGGYLQFLLALIFVLGLIGLCGLALRRLGPGMQAMRRPGAGRRLEVIEVLPLDARRRLVMVRRDDRAHLLLLGMQDDRVVETGFDAADPTIAHLAPRGDGTPDGGAPTSPHASAGPGAAFRKLVTRVGGGKEAS